MPRLVEGRYVRDYVLWLRFSDGSRGEVDLAGELDGPVFEPLRDPLYFRSFVLHAELHTVVWPNGADLAPEFLYERTRLTMRCSGRGRRRRWSLDAELSFGRTQTDLQKRGMAGTTQDGLMSRGPIDGLHMTKLKACVVSVVGAPL